MGPGVDKLLWRHLLHSASTLDFTAAVSHATVTNQSKVLTHQSLVSREIRSQMPQLLMEAARVVGGSGWVGGNLSVNSVLKNLAKGGLS